MKKSIFMIPRFHIDLGICRVARMNSNHVVEITLGVKYFFSIKIVSVEVSTL
jgi:hypothetical protein